MIELDVTAGPGWRQDAGAGGPARVQATNTDGLPEISSVDVREVAVGDSCPKCGGTSYNEMRAWFTDQDLPRTVYACTAPGCGTRYAFPLDGDGADDNPRNPADDDAEGTE